MIKLPNRSLVTISGADRRAFLQGLVSNDVNLLDTQGSVYACFLTPQGKFLHDFFIVEQDDTILLETEGGDRAEDLAKRLSVYKLRAKVEVGVEREVDVYAFLESRNLRISESRKSSKNSEIPGFRDSGILYPDPRHEEMGYRVLRPPRLAPLPGEREAEGEFEEWDRLRISLAIPDGSRDMIPERATLLESNIDRLNGVCFKKGCYMGQELTARMHYRQLTKRHLYAVRLKNKDLDFGHAVTAKDIEEIIFPSHSSPPSNSPIEEGGESSERSDNLSPLPKEGGREGGDQPPAPPIGQMRSRCGDLGLALLKDEMV